ncbi:Histone deacetylase 6 [Hypsibius exemplaris]|uniref:histone deacetylase n=1 Tax=Hypsibius exemplaris TaxID=2072580 RepID=A0A1W0WXK1_HYPEX|nr:Histone deacetylase 6 [Hypsibius exemplaris]
MAELSDQHGTASGSRMDRDFASMSSRNDRDFQERTPLTRTHRLGFCDTESTDDTFKDSVLRLLDDGDTNRVLIVDFVRHRSDGYLDDDRVLYVSIADGPHEAGKRQVVHIPLARSNPEGSDVISVFFQLLLPLAFEFNPEIVLVFVGSSSQTTLRPVVYEHSIRALRNLAGGKSLIFGPSADEDGPNDILVALHKAFGCLDTSGGPCQPLPATSAANQQTVNSVLDAITRLRADWKGLRFQDQEDDLTNSPLKTRKTTPAKKTTLPVHRVCQQLDRPIASDTFGAVEAAIETAGAAAGKMSLADKFNVPLKRDLLLEARTCLVYDNLMTKHIQAGTFSSNKVSPCPEVPGRLTSIYRHLVEAALIGECLIVDPRDVTADELMSVHSERYVELLHRKPADFEAEVERRKHRKISMRDRFPEDIWASLGTQPAILRAAGSLLNVVDTVLDNKALNGFALIRPPGHHAHHDYPAGFCFANNVAIAAKHAVVNRGLKRVLIVDWDVHHGDGSQETFYEDPRVCYISLHRGEKYFYPDGLAKGTRFTGKGAGSGFNINIPWQQEGMTDGDYVAAFLQLIMPVAYEFAPELVLVSCGFDAALGDPLGGCCVTEIGYGIMTRLLMNLAGGKVVLALEGGYNLEMISKCAVTVLKALLGYEPDVLPKPLVPSAAAVKDIKAALDAQIACQDSPWKSLQYRVILEGHPTETISSPAQKVPGTPSSSKTSRKASDLATALSSLDIE